MPKVFKVGSPAFSSWWHAGNLGTSQQLASITHLSSCNPHLQLYQTANCRRRKTVDHDCRPTVQIPARNCLSCPENTTSWRSFGISPTPAYTLGDHGVHGPHLPKCPPPLSSDSLLLALHEKAITALRCKKLEIRFSCSLSDLLFEKALLMLEHHSG